MGSHRVGSRQLQHQKLLHGVSMLQTAKQRQKSAALGQYVGSWRTATWIGLKEGIEQMKLETVPGYAEAKAHQEEMEAQRAQERESIRAQVRVRSRTIRWYRSWEW